MSHGDAPTVGERLRFLRKATGLTCEEFARQIQLAGGQADRRLVGRWEKGEVRPSAANQRPFIRALEQVGSSYPSGGSTTCVVIALAEDTTAAEWAAVVRHVRRAGQPLVVEFGRAPEP